MKELAIGEEMTIRIKCVRDEVKPTVGCPQCALGEESPLCSQMNCSQYKRKDGQNVHFELVEEKK